MTPQQKQWIDNATYEQLLQRWRFDTSGSSWFTGECGDYYVKAIAAAREKISEAEKVRASKSVGWDR